MVAQMPAALVSAAQGHTASDPDGPAVVVLASNVIAGPIVDTRVIAPAPPDRPNVVAGPIVDTPTRSLLPSTPVSSVAAGPIAQTPTPPSLPRVAAASSGRIFVQATEALLGAGTMRSECNRASRPWAASR